MAYTYSDWRTQGTYTGQLTRLDLHIQEVTDKITADVTKGTSSKGNASLNELLRSLEQNRERIATLAARESRGRTRRVRFG